MGTTDISVAETAANTIRNKDHSTETSLAGSVGAGGDNKPEDVRLVSNALSANGHLTHAKDNADDELTSKIITAQQDMGDGLKPDGLIKPGGPTETRYRHLTKGGLMQPPQSAAPSSQPTTTRPTTGDAAANAAITAQAKQRAVKDAKAKSLKSMSDPDRTPFQQAQNIRRIEKAKRDAAAATARAQHLESRKRERERTKHLEEMRKDQRQAAKDVQNDVVDGLTRFAHVLNGQSEMLSDDPPSVPDDVFAANRRSARYLASRSEIREFPRWEIADIEMQGAPAIAKTADLIQQTAQVAPDQAERLYRRLHDGIGSDHKELLDHALAVTPITDPRSATRDRKARRETLADRASETRRDLKESFLRELRDIGRRINLDQSVRFLDHFLDGNGEDITIHRDDAREDPFIRESEFKNQIRFEEQTLLANAEDERINEPIRSLKDGETIKIVDHWNADTNPDRDHPKDYADFVRWQAGEPDQYFSFGTRELTSTSDIQATRKGDKVHINGTVKHNANDRYDFADDDVSLGAFELQEMGRGTPFNVVREWKQTVTGTVGIVEVLDGGRLVLGNPQIRWEDMD